MLSNGFDGTNVDYKQLRSYHMINNVYFFNTIRVKEVCLLASMISTKLKINITRDTKRKASLLTLLLEILTFSLYVILLE